MEARISFRAVWFALKGRHQAVHEWNQQAVAVSHFDLKNRPILGAISHFEISRLRQAIGMDFT